jgi:hypothetical protein
MNTTSLTRETAKVVLWPVTHETAGRASRTAARASLTTREDSDTVVEWCPHTHGHKTIAAATECGTAMWKRLA